MKDQIPFEKAFQRLEEILEHLNGGQVPLEESLKLYEEADSLIRKCQKTLVQAEQKIETLVKNRQGDLLVQEDGTLAKEPFDPRLDALTTRSV